MLSHRYANYIGVVFFITMLVVAVLLQQVLWMLLPFAFLVIVFAFYFYRHTWLLLIASLPFATEVAVGSTLSTDFPSESLMLLVTGITMLLFLTKSVSIKQNYFRQTVFVVLMLMFVWYIFTAAFSTFPTLSIKFVLAKIWYFVPFVIVPIILFQQQKFIKQTAVVYTVAVSVTVLYVLWQHYKRGFLFDEVNQSVQPFYRNHVNYAAVVVCTIPVAYSLWRSSVIKYMKNIFGSLCVLLLIGLVLSYSRGAWLALVVGIVSIFLLRYQLLSKLFVLFIILVIGIVSWLAYQNKYIAYHPNYKKTIYHGEFKDHWRATFSGTDMSNAERFNRWIAGVRMQNEHPIVGFGPGTFYNNYKPYMVSYFKTWVSNNPEQSTVHNYFLLTLIEQGWPGFILLILLIYFVYRNFEKAYTYTNSFIKNTSIVGAVIFTMVLVLNFLSDLVETDKVGSIFFTCVALSLILRTNKDLT